MDKKSLIGLLVIGLILFGFTWYNSKQQQKFTQEQAVADSIYRAQNPEAVKPIEVVPTNISVLSTDSLAILSNESARKQHFGDYLYSASNGEEQLYTVETDLVKLTLSNKGGRVKSVELKDYKKFAGDALLVFEPESSKFDISFFIMRNYNNMEVNTGGYYFATDTPATSTFEENQTEKIISMKLYVDSLSYVEYVYTIAKDDYMIDFKVNFVNMAGILSNQSDFGINWENTSYQNERGFKNENSHTTIFYMYPNQDSPEDLRFSDASQNEDIRNKVKWVAFKQQFFSSIFIADKEFDNANIQFDTYSPDNKYMKDFKARLSVPMSAQNTSYDFQFYFGPNKYSVLNKYDLGLQRLIPLGWGILGWVNRLIVIPIFDFLGRFISNYGIIILILTIIIKIIISPLTYKSYLSTAKMRLLKPEIDAINEKFPKSEDAMKKQQAVMELYKKAGVSPMGGCIPLLIQLPILIALFRFFPSSIELRGESFLWAQDLSSYDSILNLPFEIPFYGAHVSLFAILMSITMFISSKMNYAQTAAAGPQMAGMKFMMLYMMPVMMLLWFNNYASGLSYYYFLSLLITIGQTYAFRYIVNDKKLHDKMKANANKKPKKKSKFQERYENMVKEAQKQQQTGKRK